MANATKPKRGRPPNPAVMARNLAIAREMMVAAGDLSFAPKPLRPKPPRGEISKCAERIADRYGGTWTAARVFKIAKQYAEAAASAEQDSIAAEVVRRLDAADPQRERQRIDRATAFREVLTRAERGE